MNKTTKIILNFSIVFLLFSCEKDLYDDKIYQSKINFEKVSLKDSKSIVKINYNLLKAVSKINKKKQNVNGKIVYDSINNIYFDDEKGIKISKEDYESYTFKIIKNNGKLENLLFTKNINNEFDAFKIKYDFTEEEIKLLNSQDVKPSEIISLSQTIDNSKMIYITFLISACNLDPWDCSGSICGFNEVTFEMWVNEGGSEGNDNNGNGSSGGGSGVESSPTPNYHGDNSNNGSPTIPLITIPVHGPPLVVSPCNKIKKQFTKFPTLKQSLLDLQLTTPQNVENGIFIDNSSTSSTPDPIKNFTLGTNGIVTLNTNTTNPFLMVAHTHNSPSISTFSVPSLEDMRQIADIGTAGNLDDNFVFYTITADGTRYAITVEDSQSFTDFFYNPLNHPNEDYDFVSANNYLEIATDYYLFKDDYPSYRPLIMESNTDNQTDLLNFLSFLKKANLGATVFKVSQDFNTFTKVTLSSNNNTIQYDDCN